ncbi:MAG: competence/damage-inducible protein A, partial [Alphaproteobacteria bacterium]
MSAPVLPTACLLIIGNEILSGRTRDEHIPYFGKRLNEWGIRLSEVRVIPDDKDVIAETVNACRARHDYLFTTGGIGPTHDDVTAAAVAAAFGLSLECHPKAVEILNDYYGPERINEARLRMAEMPKGAELIANPVSKSPGFRMENVFVLPGPPLVLQAMLEGVRSHLTGGPPILARAVSAELGEGVIAAGLAEIQARHPEVEIGSYPYFRSGRLGVSVVVRGVGVFIAGGLFLRIRRGVSLLVGVSLGLELIRFGLD